MGIGALALTLAAIWRIKIKTTRNSLTIRKQKAALNGRKKMRPLRKHQVK